MMVDRQRILPRRSASGEDRGHSPLKPPTALSEPSLFGAE